MSVKPQKKKWTKLALPLVGHCILCAHAQYQAFNYEMKYAQAEAYCIGRGGALATITSATDNQWVVDRLQLLIDGHKPGPDCCPLATSYYQNSVLNRCRSPHHTSHQKSREQV